MSPEFPAPVIAAQLDQESGFSDPTSSTGAQGPAQFEPATWMTWGNGGNVHDPVAAIDAQARFDAALAGQVKAAQAAGQIHSSASVTEMALGATTQVSALCSLQVGFRRTRRRWRTCRGS